MANFTISIANTLRTLGAGPPTRWGTTTSFGPYTMTWGTDKWGSESEDFIQDVMKLVTDSLASDSDITEFKVEFVFANTLGLSSETVSELLSNGVWNYLFPGQVTQAENRITTTYSSGTSATQSFTTATAVSTTWS